MVTYDAALLRRESRRNREGMVTCDAALLRGVSGDGTREVDAALFRGGSGRNRDGMWGLMQHFLGEVVQFESGRVV